MRAALNAVARTDEFEDRARDQSLAPWQWQFLLAADGRKRVEELARACDVDEASAVAFASEGESRGLLWTATLSLEAYRARFVATPAAAEVAAAAPPDAAAFATPEAAAPALPETAVPALAETATSALPESAASLAARSEAATPVASLPPTTVVRLDFADFAREASADAHAAAPVAFDPFAFDAPWDAPATDAQMTDAHVTDAHATDGHATDGHATGAFAADAHAWHAPHAEMHADGAPPEALTGWFDLASVEPAAAAHEPRSIAVPFDAAAYADAFGEPAARADRVADERADHGAGIRPVDDDASGGAWPTETAHDGGEPATKSVSFSFGAETFGIPSPAFAPVERETYDVPPPIDPARNASPVPPVSPVPPASPASHASPAADAAAVVAGEGAADDLTGVLLRALGLKK